MLVQTDTRVTLEMALGSPGRMTDGERARAAALP
jgi:hypothetical protein